MLQYADCSSLFNQILLLRDTKPETAKEILENFITDYRLEECRAILWTMVETCLTTDNGNFSEPEERADLLLRNNHFQQLFEAVFVLARSWVDQKKAI